MSMTGLTTSVPDLARRMKEIDAFYVMGILARARELEADGRSIIHMEIGEPDFISPEPVVRAGIEALQAGETHYTPAVGLPALREAIARYYKESYGVDVAPRRIVITPGASGALLLALGVLIDPGDEVLMADPGYPCNRHFVRMFEGRPRSMPVGPETAYQLTDGLLGQSLSKNTRAVMLASPSNPTGTLVDAEQMKAMCGRAAGQGAAMLVDEIYHGLVYDERRVQTALAFSDDVFVLNSFSKYFGMTGWRLGWLVVPDTYVDAVDRLAQNIFLAASTPAQYAALSAFSKETQKVLEQRRDEFRVRRDYLLPALRELGFNIPVTPQGAFYLYADCSAFTNDSFVFARQLLEEAGVAVTPGCDFGEHLAEQHIRFAYTTSLDNLREGVERIKQFLS